MLAYFSAGVLWQASEARAEGLFKNFNMLFDHPDSPLKTIVFK